MVLNKDEQLLAYLTKNHSEPTVTSLMKLAYLLDLTSIKETQKKISTFEYKRYNFGPFDQSIYEVLNSLVEKNVLRSETIYGFKGEYVVYRFNSNFDKPATFKSLKRNIKLIDKLLNTVGAYGAKILTEIAYQTKPMKALKATLGGNEGMNKKLNLNAR